MVIIIEFGVRKMVDCKKPEDVTDQYGNTPEEKDKIIKQSMKDNYRTRAEALEHYKDFDNCSLFPSDPSKEWEFIETNPNFFGWKNAGKKWNK